jgi:aminoglycoside phosphotransferase (APT) family kinase protein
VASAAQAAPRLMDDATSRSDAAPLDLQLLFPEPILEQVAYPAAYSDHTNDVWRVRTATEEVVVRAPRPTAELASPFWWGAQKLFGVDPTQPRRLAALNAHLATLSALPIPRVLRAGTCAGREYLVMEHLPGTPLADLRALPPAALRDLGAALARIHRHEYGWWGVPDNGPQRALDTFHSALAGTLRALVARFYREDTAITNALAHFHDAALRLPAPATAALIMLDVDATQFLAAEARITALVDTEAYVVAPRALDFIGYEYELDAASAAAFAAGYRALLPLPALATVRPVYRYLYRLLGVQGQIPLDDWLAWPILFTD